MQSDIGGKKTNKQLTTKNKHYEIIKNKYKSIQSQF